MSILLALILAVNLSILAVILVVFMKARRIYAEFREFITPPDENTPSGLATVATSLADQVARSAIGSLKATFMAKKSGDVRAEQSIQTDLALDIASEANPIVGQLLTGIPALRKLAKKNPGLIDLVLSRLTIPGGNGSSPAQPAMNNQARFKL